ncbi:MAG: hypothetical protein AB1489_05005 [Acidobacteriota bacterium]
MEISKGVIRYYLNSVSSYIADHGSLPDDVTGYYDYIVNMKLDAIKQGDLTILRLAIDYLLTHTAIDPASFSQMHYHYDADEFQELLLYIRSVVWPELPPPDPDEVKDIKFINISAGDWWEIRKAQQKTEK